MLQKQLNINHSPEFEVTETLWNKYILENYNFGYMYLPIKEELEKFKNEIIVNFDTKSYLYNFPSIKVHYLESDKIYIQIDERKDLIDVHLFTKTRNDMDILLKLFDRYKSTEDKFINFTEISNVSGKILEKTKEINLKDLDYLSTDFYPFLDTDKLINMFLKGKENLLILGGKPGCGKSKFISYILKYILENETEDFKVASAKDIGLLSMDLFWQKASNFNLLVLDDLDFMLGSRNENREDIDKNNFLSKLLSFTDGVIDNKTKIIITTNQPINEIDDALLREGRIFDILNFRYLTKNEAETILNKYDIEAELEDTVPQSKVGSLIENQKELGSFNRDYLKEDISLLHKKHNKTVGFI